LLRAWKQETEREACSLIGMARPAATQPDSQLKLDKIRPWIGKYYEDTEECWEKSSDLPTYAR
jgi:hypothetical protein